MDVREQLAIITALKKFIANRERELRSQADAEFAQLHSAFGTERMGLTVNGTKVGDYIMAFNPEGFTVTDRDAFEEFALDYGLASVKRTIRPSMMGAAIQVIEGSVEPENVRDYIDEEVVVVSDWEDKLVSVAGKVLFQDSGMEVPGVAFRPRSMQCTKVNGCKPDAVIPLVQVMPGGIDALLLGSGE